MDKLNELRIKRGQAYNVAVRYIKEHKDEETDQMENLKCLVGQFYYGLEPQQELYDKCVEYGLMKG